MNQPTRPSSADTAAAVALSLVAVLVGIVLTGVVALLQSGVSACGPGTNCDYAALEAVGLITPSVAAVGVVFILAAIYFRRRSRRIWWIPLPVIGGTVIAFLISAGLTTALLP